MARVTAAVSEFLNIWACAGNASLKLDTKKGGCTVSFTANLGHPGALLLPTPAPPVSPSNPESSPSSTPSPLGQRYRGPASPCFQPTPSSSASQRYRGSGDRQRSRVRAATHQAAAKLPGTAISPLKSAASEKKETCAKAETVSETILKGTSVKTELTGDMGSASCQPLPAEVKCWNCDQLMTPDHQCDSVAISSQLNGKSPPTPPITSEGVVDVKLPPLPLCHYCCHRGIGSGPDNPGAVHYLLQCLCPDRVCSCQCYCTEEQMVHRVKFYPDGFKASTMVPVDPADRPRAKEIAEARYDKLCKWPCESPDCPR